MNKIKDKHPDDFKVEVLPDSIKLYFIDMASNYMGMSLIEFDGYFEGKFEPVKYIGAENILRI